MDATILMFNDVQYVVDAESNNESYGEIRYLDVHEASFRPSKAEYSVNDLVKIASLLADYQAKL